MNLDSTLCRALFAALLAAAPAGAPAGGSPELGSTSDDILARIGAKAYPEAVLINMLEATCHPCAAEVCSADAFCCESNWDAQTRVSVRQDKPG